MALIKGPSGVRANIEEIKRKPPVALTGAFQGEEVKIMLNNTKGDEYCF